MRFSKSIICQYSLAAAILLWYFGSLILPIYQLYGPGFHGIPGADESLNSVMAFRLQTIPVFAGLVGICLFLLAIDNTNGGVKLSGYQEALMTVLSISSLAIVLAQVGVSIEIFRSIGVVPLNSNSVIGYWYWVIFLAIPVSIFAFGALLLACNLLKRLKLSLGIGTCFVV